MSASASQDYIFDTLSSKHSRYWIFICYNLVYEDFISTSAKFYDKVGSYINDLKATGHDVIPPNGYGVDTDKDIAKSLCPFFLIRVTSYLKEAKDSKIAENIITKQTKLIYNEYSRANI